MSKSQAASTRRSIGALLVAAVVGATLTLVAYCRVAELPRAPGDWLWNGPISTVADARAAVGGPILDAVTHIGHFSNVALARQRLLAPAAILATVALLTLLTTRRKASPITPICTLSAIGLLPLTLGDPSEIMSQALLLAFPAIAALSFAPLPAVLVGALGGATMFFVAGHSKFIDITYSGNADGIGFVLGCGIFCAGCVAQRQRGWRPALLAGLSFVVVALGIDVLRALRIEDEDVLKLSSRWWHDANAACTSAIGPKIIDAGSGLGCVAAFVGATLCTYTRRLGITLAIASALVAAFLAGASIAPMRARAATLERDATSFLAEYSRSTTLQTIPHILINLPEHVRPLLDSNAFAASCEAHDQLFTPDLGESIHIPAHWRFDESRIVLRWTAKGIQKSTWREILDLPPMPSCGLLREQADEAILRALGDAPADWLSVGTLERALGEHVDFDVGAIASTAYADAIVTSRLTTQTKDAASFLFLVQQSQRRTLRARERESLISVREALSWNKFRLAPFERPANDHEYPYGMHRVAGCFWIVDVQSGRTHTLARRP